MSRGDLEGLTYAAAHVARSQEPLDSYLHRLAAKTSQYLDRYWNQVEALAKALLQRRVLSGRQVMAILRGVER
jgi:hypothetical protein